MWNGIPEYLLFVALIAAVMHSVSRRYGLCIVVASVTTSGLSLLHEAWLVNWQVNLGWGPPMLVIGALLAIPVAAVTGLPFFLIRKFSCDAATV